MAANAPFQDSMLLLTLNFCAIRAMVALSHAITYLTVFRDQRREALEGCQLRLLPNHQRFARHTQFVGGSPFIPASYFTHFPHHIFRG